MIAPTRRRVENTVLQIAEAMTQNDDSGSAGLLGGKAGQVLLYGHLYLCFGAENHFERFAARLDACIEWVADHPTDATLSRGFTGLMWVIQHFIRVGLLEKEANQSIADLNEPLVASFEGDCTNRDYDLLHGLIGKGMYFLECPPEAENAAALERIVGHLESFAVTEEATLSWTNPVTLNSLTEKDGTCNLGMAHGVPGIIGFLAKVHRRGVAPDQTRALLEKSVRWLLRQEKPIGYSRFPISTASEHQSRLAWCYGDLGPALALLHAANALNRTDWRSQAIDLARHAGRRTVESAGLHRHHSQGWLDTGFCHGTAGIAHAFNRFYQATRQREFNRCAQYWLALTTPPLLTDQGIAGYVHPHYEAKGSNLPWRENPTLLEGATGVGLVLLSFLRPRQPAWDGIFMTDVY